MAAAGLSLAGLLTFAFFLGSLHARVSDAADKIDKLYNVVAVDKDSLQSRVSVMENKVTSIESRLASIESRVGVIEADLKEIKELMKRSHRTR